MPKGWTKICDGLKMVYWTDPEKTFRPLSKWSPQKVLSLRASLTLSQPYFAALLGVNVSTVQAWENGRRKVNGSTARLLQIIAEQKQVVERLAVRFRA